MPSRHHGLLLGVTASAMTLNRTHLSVLSAYQGLDAGLQTRQTKQCDIVSSPCVACDSGLDPSSRRLLWDVIQEAKKSAAIVMTTHSMEEAEALCDRIGIFVGGRLSCIGSPQVGAAARPTQWAVTA